MVDPVGLLQTRIAFETDKREQPERAVRVDSSQELVPRALGHERCALEVRLIGKSDCEGKGRELRLRV